MDWPWVTILAHVVAEIARGSNNIAAQVEETEILLRATLPLRSLILEKCRAQEIAILAFGKLMHRLQVALDKCSLLAIGAILTNKPWRWREAGVILRNHLLEKIPRRLRVEPVNPSCPEGTVKICP